MKSENHCCSRSVYVCTRLGLCYVGAPRVSCCVTMCLCVHVWTVQSCPLLSGFAIRFAIQFVWDKQKVVQCVNYVYLTTIFRYRWAPPIRCIWPVLSPYLQVNTRSAMRLYLFVFASCCVFSFRYWTHDKFLLSSKWQQVQSFVCCWNAAAQRRWLVVFTAAAFSVISSDDLPTSSQWLYVVLSSIEPKRLFTADSRCNVLNRKPQKLSRYVTECSSLPNWSSSHEFTYHSVAHVVSSDFHYRTFDEQIFWWSETFFG